MRRIVIIGGGYAGLHAFSALRSRLRSALARHEVEITLISRYDHHTYHGWTGEVVAGDVSAQSTHTPLRPLVGDSFLEGDVIAADLPGKVLTVRSQNDELRVRFDHLVIAAGSTDPFDRIPGLAENGWCFKDANDMRKLVARLEDVSVAKKTRNVVVIGGGLAGVETASALAARFGKESANGRVSIHLVSAAASLLPTLRPAFDHIAELATRTLVEQGVQLHCGQRVAHIGETGVQLADGTTLQSDLSVVAAGVSFRVLPGTEKLPRNRAGQIIATDDLRVSGTDNIWVAGDIASVAHPVTGELCPTNALWAMKEGDCVGRNVARVITGRPTRDFGFRGLGQAAGLAGQRGIAELYNFQFSGRLAWLIRIAFFAWYMPSRRLALPVLSRLSQNLYRSALAGLYRAQPQSSSARPTPVAKLSGPLR